MTHREKREVAIAMAEQQLLGFAHCHEGFSFRDLLESMNLKKKNGKQSKKIIRITKTKNGWSKKLTNILKRGN